MSDVKIDRMIVAEAITTALQRFKKTRPDGLVIDDRHVGDMPNPYIKLAAVAQLANGVNVGLLSPNATYSLRRLYEVKNKETGQREIHLSIETVSGVIKAAPTLEEAIDNYNRKYGSDENSTAVSKARRIAAFVEFENDSNTLDFYASAVEVFEGSVDRMLRVVTVYQDYNDSSILHVDYNNDPVNGTKRVDKSLTPSAVEDYIKRSINTSVFVRVNY